MHHYVTKHEYSEEEVKQKDIFNPLKFRPFKCHLCSKGYKERKELKAHYRLKHNKNMAVAEQTNCSLKKKAEDTPALQAPDKPDNKVSSGSSKKKAEDTPALQAPTRPNSKEGSGSLKAKEVPVEKKNVPALKDRAVVLRS